MKITKKLASLDRIPSPDLKNRLVKLVPIEKRRRRRVNKYGGDRCRRRHGFVRDEIHHIRVLLHKRGDA